MVENSNVQNPRNLNRALFDLAKYRRRESILMKILVFLIGLASVFFNFMPALSPFLVAILSGWSEYLAWKSNFWKSKADALLGKLDFMDSLGWSISGSEMSDLIVSVPGRIRKKLQIYDTVGEYFASAKPPGYVRAIENVQESAWWSKHLANTMGVIYIIITTGILIISISLLIFSILTIRDFNTLSNMGRASISIIMLIFSLGSLQLSVSYYNFSRSAFSIEKRSEQLLEKTNITEIDSIKIFHDYQIARIKSPLLPSWIWKWKRNELNEAWDQYRKRT